MLWNPEATPEDGAVDGGGAQVVQGECDCGLDARYDTPDDRGGAVVPTQHDDDVPRTQLDGFSLQDHPPDGGGVQDVQGGGDWMRHKLMEV
jgi:hypothetical protein